MSVGLNRHSDGDQDPLAMRQFTPFGGLCQGRLHAALTVGLCAVMMTGLTGCFHVRATVELVSDGTAVTYTELAVTPLFHPFISSLEQDLKAKGLKPKLTYSGGYSQISWRKSGFHIGEKPVFECSNLKIWISCSFLDHIIFEPKALGIERRQQSLANSDDPPSYDFRVQLPAGARGARSTADSLRITADGRTELLWQGAIEPDRTIEISGSFWMLPW